MANLRQVPPSVFIIVASSLIIILLHIQCSESRNTQSFNGGAHYYTNGRSKRIRNASDITETIQLIDDRVLELLGGLENFEFLRTVWEPRLAAHSGHENALHYTNEWLVHIPPQQEATSGPDRIANETGYVNLGQVPGFEHVYRFIKIDHPTAHQRGARDLTDQLENKQEVVWAEQQYSKQREKRQFASMFNEFYNTFISPLDNLIGGSGDEPKRQTSMQFNDPLWDKQWYMQSVSPKRSDPNPALQVIPVFAMGVTGRGVGISVLDDGLDHTHPDIRESYDPKISTDLNDADNDPMPRATTGHPNSHGTRCAGEIAMKPNNSICGVGIAPGARIGGIRMLDGPISDRIEGTALNYAMADVDIYSCSWGPSDDGRTVEGPGRLAQEAFLRSVAQGRNGKGIIHIWASGNGGANGDSCACDGYASNVYTLSIGSATQSDSFPWYGEKCPATMAVTYSSGSAGDAKVATTDINNGCTTGHTGTSASAPLAAGMVALALEVNPSLTWRDVKHLIAWTARPEPLYKNPGWRSNGAGFQVNEKFGFGLMDAYAMVMNARNWTNVGPQRICRAKAVPIAERTFTGTQPVKIQFATDGCRGTPNAVRRIEHVVLLASVQFTRRGSLAIDLRSPQGSDTRMLFPRSKDDSPAGFENWPFVSVHNWGENPDGVWTVTIEDATHDWSNRGMLGGIDLLFYGTVEEPSYYARGPKWYASNAPAARSLDGPEYQPAEPLSKIQKLLRSLEEEQTLALRR